MIDKTRVQIRLGRYGTAPATALANPQLHTRAQDYRRGLGMRMIPLDRADVSRKLPNATYHVSRKVDGEFAVLALDGGEALLVNPGGLVRVGLPALDEAAKLATTAGLARGLFAVELYVARPDGKRSRVHDVGQVARQPATAAELATLRLAVFDAIELDGAPAPAAFDDAWREIVRIFGAGKAVHPVESLIAKDADAVRKAFEQWVLDEGAEGVVARSDVAGWWKIKPRHTLDACVIGFTEGTDDRAGMLHDLLLALMRKDGTFHILGRVGGGFDDDQRRAFLSDLKDLVVESDYAEVNDHVAYRMVRPEWVIEISCLDLVSQTTRGAPVNRMVLKFGPPDGAGPKAAAKWEPLRRLPLCALIAPQFVRRREDKAVVPADLRIEQVADLVEVDLAEKDATGVTLGASKVLRRLVFTKELKGQTMVRKFVLWKTNKDQESPEFPAYVAHFTDFSPNRKDALQRDVRVSSSREQIEALFDGLVADNVKQGWVAMGGEVVESGTSAPAHESPPAKKRGAKAPVASAAPEPADVPAVPPVAEPAPTPTRRSRGKAMKAVPVDDAAPAPAVAPAIEAASPREEAPAGSKRGRRAKAADTKPDAGAEPAPKARRRSKAAASGPARSTEKATTGKAAKGRRAKGR